jgi:ribosomal protein L16/L10AE
MIIQYANEPVPAKWTDENSDLMEFLKNSTWSDFFQSLHRYALQHGRLTEKQEAAARRGMAKCMAREAERKAQVVPESNLDISPLSGYYAVPDGDTRLKILVQHGQGKWQGWIFVKDGAVYGEGNRLGVQKPGQKYSGKVTQQISEILADPIAAQIAYGKITGTCGACGRHLEDEKSIEMGIGPICATRLGV